METNLITYAFFIALIWWVYIHITAQPDMIMNWLYNKVDDITYGMGWYPNKLFTCEYCLAGCTALIAFPFLFDYNALVHIVFISLCIFIVHIFNKFLT
jgi:hypothetical protein